jgi:predicted nucleic acid-binding protein
MLVVSNTSPLIALAKIEQFKFLQALFGKLLIPPVVRDEFLSNCPSPEENEFSHAHFIEVLPVHTLILCKRRLGKGEHAVLSLAVPENANVLLIDDRKAFNEATEQGLFAVSTRALLRIAEEKRLIDSYVKVEAALKIKRFFLTNY